MKKASLVILLCTSLNLSAQESENVKEVELSGVEVTAEQEDVKSKKISEVKKTAKELTKQQVSDTRDMVRYDTGVSVVESGRFGTSGYAIRGVDENRVAISIDGLAQAETLSSQGFKDLFEGYGNFNNTRNGVEIENIQQVNITKGADSIKIGSGALGGSVMFETKDARDYLTEKDWFYGFKAQKSSANDENLFSHTMAARAKWFDILFVTTKREGHEMKNWGYKTYDDEVLGKEREKPDPYTIRTDSRLLKFGVNFNETNRFSVGLDRSTKDVTGTDWSYKFAISKTQVAGDLLYSKDTRHVNDKNKRENTFYTYENYDENPFWDSMKITYSNQKIQLKARTDEYCDKDDCQGLQNPSGLKINNEGKLVDKYGGELSTKTIQKEFYPGAGLFYDEDIVIDSHGDQLKDNFYGTISNLPGALSGKYDIYVDCDQYDCSKPLTLFDKNTFTYNTYNLTPKDMPDGNGKYAELTPKNYGGGEELILPSQPGYIENSWKDRDLNTDTKQVNLDATKEFTLFKMNHAFRYGGLYNQTDKSMVNRQGYEAHNKAWWAKYFFGLRRKGTDFANWQPDKCVAGGGNSFSTHCKHEDAAFSFLLPVETKTNAFYLGDNITLTEILSIDLNYRYDKVTHKPTYIPSKTPKLPDDLVAGMYMPPLPDSTPDDEVKRKKAAFAEAMTISLASQNKKFKHHSYSFSTNYDPFEHIRLQAKYSNGFRAPTSDEIYFMFQHPEMIIFPNLSLKPEIAKTKEFAVTLHNSPSFFTINIFQTDYKNFIDLKYIDNYTSPYGNAGSRLPVPRYQNVNRAKARVRGFELSANLDLEQVYEKLSGFNVGYKYLYQKGRMSVDESGKLDAPMNAIQPAKFVYNIGYHTKNEKFGANLYMTHIKAKHPEDTYNMYAKDDPDAKNTYVRYVSNTYSLIDFVTFYRPMKNFTFTAGLYNITDRKYMSWDSARSIRTFGTNNMVDKDTGRGLARFYAPGRNFKLTFEMTF
jgi:TonB-dependent hemoglobin/transferrin/lactoferrin receptor family protein